MAMAVLASRNDPVTACFCFRSVKTRRTSAAEPRGGSRQSVSEKCDDLSHCYSPKLTWDVYGSLWIYEKKAHPN